jgi:serine/threonine-protein kinase RsbW
MQGKGMACMAYPSAPHLCAQVVIPADPLAVREGLKALFDTILLRSLPEDRRGTAEIVLAEALNNIVEHAYARHSGDIEITLDLRGPDLVCRILDSGLPMPKETLPEGRLIARADVSNLPEGGFGWFLIRALSRDLDYRRVGGRNLLSFRLNTQQAMV